MADIVETRPLTNEEVLTDDTLAMLREGVRRMPPMTLAGSDEEAAFYALGDSILANQGDVVGVNIFLPMLVDEILRLRTALAEAEDNAWPFGQRPNSVAGHTFGDFAVYGDEKSIKRVRAAMHEYDAMMPARIQRIHELTARATAAEAALKEAREVIKHVRDRLIFDPETGETIDIAARIGAFLSTEKADG